jgi:hypothetical protein
MNRSVKSLTISNLEKIENDSTDTSIWAMTPSEIDEQVNIMLTNLTFKVLLAMNARPELISKGVNTGKKLKHGKSVWTPNFIGNNYKVETKNSNQESSYSVRLHWTRGHFRQQPYGKDRLERKTIWIEPFISGSL